MRTKPTLIFIFISLAFIISVVLITADLGVGKKGTVGINLIPTAPINYSSTTVNSTNCWTTIEGTKCNIADITFDEISAGNLDNTDYNITADWGKFNSINVSSDSIYIGGVKISELNGELNISENVTSPYFIGDGSGLWNVSFLQTYESIAMLNESNIFQGNQTINGSLHTGDNTRGYWALINERGDAVIGNRLFTQNMIMSFSAPYGIAMAAHQYSSSLLILSTGGTATLTANTKTICDSTDPFTSAHEDQFLTVIDSTPSFTDATGEIKTYINSSCIKISFASAGADSIVSATGMSYYVYPHPIFVALDNGAISSEIGENPDAKFEIHIHNGTGFHAVYIEDTAGTDNHQSLTVDTDGKGHDGIVGINSFISSSQPAENKRMTNLLLEADATGMNHSTGYAIEINLLGQPGVGTKYDAMFVDPNVEHIIHMGSSGTIVKAYYDNGLGSTTDVTTEFTTTDSNTNMFENDNSIIYIGNTLNFTTMGISLSTEASGDILAEYYYCNGDDSWVPLSEVTDTTNGMRTSGTITFENPVDRGMCNEEIDSTAFANTTDYTYVAIKRTRFNIVTPPQENLISVGGGSTFMFLDKYGLKPYGSDGAPYVCSTDYWGMTYHDTTANALLWCDGASWIEFAETSDVTIHNNLGGLQGGQATEYYHFTADEHSNMCVLNAENIFTEDVTIEGNLNITGNITTNEITVNNMNLTTNFTIGNSCIYDNGSALILQAGVVC